MYLGVVIWFKQSQDNKLSNLEPWFCVDLLQDLPGDGCDCAGARKHPQNDPWGVVNISARKKKFFFNSLLNHFIHFQLQILLPYAFKFHQM
jgi:hypothetical protein